MSIWPTIASTAALRVSSAFLLASHWLPGAAPHVSHCFPIVSKGFPIGLVLACLPSLHRLCADLGVWWLVQVFENVPIQPRDAREASDVFYKQYQGDVSLNYENEVILTNEMYGENALPYVVPDNNVLVGHSILHQKRTSW